LNSFYAKKCELCTLYVLNGAYFSANLTLPHTSLEFAGMSAAGNLRFMHNYASAA